MESRAASRGNVELSLPTDVGFDSHNQYQIDGPTLQDIAIADELS